jgi:isopentenyl-diphosphate delta-isomerase
LWSNTCCGHPRPGESVEEASHRRLKEEMGFDCELKEIFSFIYRIELDNNLFEHEYDHVLIGTFNNEPTPNRDEVDDWKWMDQLSIKKEIQDNPDKFTYWLRLSLHEVINIFGDGNKKR